MTYEQFRKTYPATRCFQRFETDDRALRSSSHRLGHRQREAVGEYFYTHPRCPGAAFPTAKAATQEAYRAFIENPK